MATPYAVGLSAHNTSLSTLGLQLYDGASGSPGTTANSTTMGTATGYGVLYPKGASSWASGSSIGNNTSGRGWFLDNGDLLCQQIIAGTWNASIKLVAVQGASNAGTLTADVIVRVSSFNTSSSTLTTIVTMTATGQTITSTNTTYNVSGTGIAWSFNDSINDVLFVDVWLNITANANGSSSQGVKISKLSLDSTGFTIDPAATITTPGIVSLATSITQNMSGLETVQAIQIAIVSETITQNMSVSETVQAIDITIGSETISEGPYGVEALSTVDILLTIETISENATGLEAITLLIAANYTISEGPYGAEQVEVYRDVYSSLALQMTASDLEEQYERILASVIAPQIQTIATTYYGMTTTSEVIYGELDALLTPETINQLHVMRTVADVSSFLKSVEYECNVLNDLPVIYHQLSDSVGSMTASDIAGRGYTGNVYGGVTFGQPGSLSGSSNTSAQFDGSTGYIQLPPGVNTANWNKATFEARVKLTNNTFSGKASMIGNDTPSTSNIGVNFALTSSSIVFNIGAGSSYQGVSYSITLTVGTWYHIAAVYSGSQLILYLNGSPVATVAGTGARIASSPNPMKIGYKLPGNLDNVAGYANTALSPARILAHANAATNP